MNSLLLDLAVALRFFRRRRAAVAVCLLTMAFALGANTAVFTALKAFLFGNLGFAEPERVVIVWTVRNVPGQGASNFSDAYPNVELLRSTTLFWSQLGTSTVGDANWSTDDGQTIRLQGAFVEASFFPVFGVRPALGRFFEKQEEGPSAAPVIVISHALWRGAFAGSPDVVGRKLRLNGGIYEIVGVAPEVFSQPQGTEVWFPLNLSPAQRMAILGARQCITYARLAAGVDVAQANEQLRAFAKVAIAARAENKDWTWSVQVLRDALLSGADRSLILVQSGALVLLLLGVANLAAVLLAWAMERQRESAIRVALGATRWRITRQFLIQAALLALGGGLLGLAFAWFALPLLQRLNPTPGLSAFVSTLQFDAGVFGFSAGLILAVALLGGALPALLVNAGSLLDAIRSESRGASADRRGLRWQQAMVVVQIGVSVLILVIACLAGAGFYQLNGIDPGFRVENRAAFQIQFPEPAYASHEKRTQFVRDLESNLAREPQIKAFGFTTTLAVGDFLWGAGMHPQLPSGEFSPDPIMFQIRRVTPGYVPAMGIPLVAGRHLTADDRAGRPGVVVVSKAVAEKYWPGESAIGRKLKPVAPANAAPLEIVGVVGNVRDAGLTNPPSETVYVSFDQISQRRGWVVMEGAGPAELIAAGRRALHATSSEVAAYNASGLDRLLWQANALPRLQMTLLAVFAGIALALAGLGTYGVMSQVAASREKELAIRLALGASRVGVLGLVLEKNARLSLMGITAGLLVAWLAARWARSNLTAFPAELWWPFLVVVPMVFLLSQVASYFPTRRAASGDMAKKLSG